MFEFKSVGISRIFSTKAFVVAAAICLPFGAASAATFEPGVTYRVTNQSSSHSWNSVFRDSSNASSSAWYRTVKMTVGHHTSASAAGVFRMQAWDGQTMQDFLAYCLTPWQELAQPNVYHTDATLGLRSETIGQLGALVKSAWNQVVNSDTAAAFQLAAWEIVTENDRNPLDLDHGRFKLKGVWNGGRYTYDAGGVRALAQGWLNGITPASWTTDGFTMLQYANDCHKTQNLLTVAPVPLPATGLLMLGGFGLLAGLRRRKRAA